MNGVGETTGEEHASSTRWSVPAALRRGLVGLRTDLLLKDASASQLAEEVRVVAAGEALLAPTVTKRLIAEFSRLGAPRGASTTRIKRLTARETQVPALVAQGFSNAEIAAHLVVAEQTVKTHIGRILAKLGLRDRTQAAVFAWETGLVTSARQGVTTARTAGADTGGRPLTRTSGPSLPAFV